ncbi:MAG: DNA-3-methyladenine glycosylase [Acidimicrobiia bacterium]|nr:DNA-3-methyladenine glycosylase [Acidimicrobiia bacterium]
MSGSLRALLDGPVLEAARGLLGRRLISEIDGARCEVVLTEVEAYGGGSDPASHAFRGPTPRTGVMFGPAGRLYVYLSYGVHWCMNVVTGPAGEAAAVLLRGGRAVAGLEIMEQRRGRSDHLVDGPGKLCQALGVTGTQDGVSLFDGVVRIGSQPPVAGRILSTPRVGISKAAERPWRFVLEDQGVMSAGLAQMVTEPPGGEPAEGC